MIAGAGLTKRFEGTVAVDDVTVELEPGSVTALLGPNGTGKTTLIRLLHLLTAPDEGTVTWDGRPVGPDDLDVRRRMALVAQEPHLFRGTVRDNVALPLQLRDRRFDDRVDALLDRFGLTGIADRSVGDVSGGEAQRTAIARALAPDPDVLFLDEFASNLDRQALRDCEAAVDDVAGDAAVLLVTHDLDQVRRLADRALLLGDGRLRLDGPVKAVLDDLPATPGGRPGSGRGRRPAWADPPR